ncbi:hypothetical protein [Methylomicrobium sp. Wu6]|uniref:hypothetical protein n=1 Tax=Methylomicrobium sp. Wu6 TaxID=3107928 RepID=UPI002DD654AD|nr:hypothetical protein [Methylomicrobium sp. Wu6]MEC4747408.1 hypothetical protein [Methylomicrobium sp. Wu6]
MDLLHDRLYYRPSELANRWNVSIDFLMQLGLTNQLKFKAEVDWYYPATQTIYRGSHVNVDYEELANIYYAPTSFDVEAYAGKAQNPPGVLPGDPCIITYYPGLDRLLIDAAEVNDYEKCHQESLHQSTVAESLDNWSNDDEFERLEPSHQLVPGTSIEPIPGKLDKPLNNDKELLQPILKRAKIKRLPEKLGLNDISTLMFHHRREKEGVFSWSMMQFNFVRWIMNQIEGGQIPIEGYTSRALVCLGPSVLEPIIHKDEIYTCLQILDLLPLEEGCLLANWWQDEAKKDKKLPKTNTAPSIAETGLVYQDREEDFDNWRNHTGIALDVLKVEEILQQVRQWSKNKKLWNIKGSAFRRAFWQPYSQKHSIQKKGGRRSKNRI